jgi:RNA polymerase sporulation-specific sigma factor
MRGTGGYMARPESAAKKRDFSLAAAAKEELLVEQYLPLVRSRASALMGNGVEPEDLVQEGLIGLLHAIRAFDARRLVSFSTFAYRCITNRMLNSIQAAGKSRLSFRLEDGALADDPGSPTKQEDDPQEIIIVREQTEQWLHCMAAQLSDFEQQALRLYLSGYTYHEMAASLACTTKAVDNALQRARRKLRAQ